jgi:hypothetical protein
MTSVTYSFRRELRRRPAQPDAGGFLLPARTPPAIGHGVDGDFEKADADASDDALPLIAVAADRPLP